MDREATTSGAIYFAALATLYTLATYVAASHDLTAGFWMGMVGIVLIVATWRAAPGVDLLRKWQAVTGRRL